MERKQALQRAVDEGWLTAEDAARMVARREAVTPPDAREDWYFVANRGVLTQVVIRMYNQDTAEDGGGRQDG